jgi:hypothetical protein
VLGAITEKDALLGPIFKFVVVVRMKTRLASAPKHSEGKIIEFVVE